MSQTVEIKTKHKSDSDYSSLNDHNDYNDSIFKSIICVNDSEISFDMNLYHLEDNFDISHEETKLDRLEYEATNDSRSIILLYCSELKRQVIEAKESKRIEFSSLEKQFNQINKQIEKYELEYQINGAQLVKELIQDQKVILKKTSLSANEYKASLNYLIKIITKIVFNNKMIKFEKSKKLSKLGSIFFKSFIDLNQMKKIDLNNLIITRNDVKKSILFDVIDHTKLVIAYSTDHTTDSYLLIYNWKSNEIEAQKKFSSMLIDKLYFLNNKILIVTCYEKDDSLIVLDTNLGVLKQNDHFGFFQLISINEESIFAYDCYYSSLNIFDWDLKRIERKFFLQTLDPTEAFYLDTKSIKEFKLIDCVDDKYVVGLETNDSNEILIFNENGDKIDSFQVDGDYSINNNTLFVIDSNKIKGFNLDGTLLDESEIIDSNLSGSYGFTDIKKKVNKIFILKENFLYIE